MAKRRPRKGEMYPNVGDVVSLVVRDGIRCAGVTIAVNPPLIVTSFLKYTFQDGTEPDYTRISVPEVLDTKMHGPLGFEDSWRVHGPLPGFSRGEWPPLIFYQHFLKRSIQYDDSDLDFDNVRVVENGDNTNQWPEDGPAGDVYVQQVIARKLEGLGTFE